MVSAAPSVGRPGGNLFPSLDNRLPELCYSHSRK